MANGEEPKEAVVDGVDEAEPTRSEADALPPDAATPQDDDPTSADSLRTALEAAQAALDEARAKAAAEEDRALRAAAEADNVRKRADRRIDDARKFALEDFVKELLPAVDSFERAAAAASREDGTMADTAKGIELSLKLLIEAMGKRGVEVVDPIGAPFDPTLHEAMTMMDNAEAEPGTVIDVFQKGYTVNGRLARPARVIVARAPAAPPLDQDA